MTCMSLQKYWRQILTSEKYQKYFKSRYVLGERLSFFSISRFRFILLGQPRAWCGTLVNKSCYPTCCGFLFTFVQLFVMRRKVGKTWSQQQSWTLNRKVISRFLHFHYRSKWWDLAPYCLKFRLMILTF